MALRGRFPVATTPQWLAGAFAWGFPGTGAAGHFNGKRLQSLGAAAPETGDIETANDIYSGSFELADSKIQASPDSIFEKAKAAPAFQKELQEFEWLKHFCVNPKHLHACFVGRALTAWCEISPSKGSVGSELARLALLTRLLPEIAKPLDANGQQPFVTALLLQVKNLKRTRIRTSDETITKALALAHAALVLDDANGLGAEASLLLETQLPLRILPDGGHVTGDQSKLLEIACAISTLEQSHGFRCGPQTRSSVDRLMQFLKMLKRGDNTFAFIPGTRDVSRLLQTFSGDQHLGLAPHSGFARLAQGKSVLIVDKALNADFSIHGRHLMVFSEFQSAAVVTARYHINLQTIAAGSFFEALGSRNSRRIFMAASGHDIRFEDQLPENTEARWLKISISETIKTTVTRDAATAMLVMPDHTVWQIMVRGARFIVEPEGHELYLKADAGPAATINWSIKKLAKPPATTKTRDNMPDLPF